MIAEFLRPSSAEEAVRLKRETPNALFLAGGTHLLSPALRGRTMVAVSLEGLLPKGIRVDGALLSIGALATLQELVEGAGGEPVESGELALLRDAALSMASRNTRNRATVGGNIAANRPTSCLVPPLLALDARLRLAGGESRPLADYLIEPGALIEAVEIPLRPGRASSYRRWARTEGDLSGVAVAVALASEAGRIAELRIAAAGVHEAGAPSGSDGPTPAVRLSSVEARIASGFLPPREEIERAVLPLLESSADIRASAAYKRLRASQLIAEALVEAAGRCRGGHR